MRLQHAPPSSALRTMTASATIPPLYHRGSLGTVSASRSVRHCVPCRLSTSASAPSTRKAGRHQTCACRVQHRTTTDLSLHMRGDRQQVSFLINSLSPNGWTHLRHLSGEAPACSLALKRLGDPSARRWCCFGRAHVLLTLRHFGGSGASASKDPNGIISRLRHVQCFGFWVWVYGWTLTNHLPGQNLEKQAAPLNSTKKNHRGQQ